MRSARTPSLPGHRHRRNRNARMSSSQIFSIFALVLTTGFILLNFWVGVPESTKNQNSSTPSKNSPSTSSTTTSRKMDLRMRRVKLEVENAGEENDAGLSGATDKYFPVRDGEILHSWDPPHGLLIDTFDVRTHDPLNPNANKLTVSVNPKKEKQSYFLSAVISTQLSRHSSLHLSMHHIREWVEFMKYAGVEHIYYYDTSNTTSELQEKYLKPFIHQGFLTYFRLHTLYPLNLDSPWEIEKYKSAVHCINNFGYVSRWLISLDLNEYLIMPKDMGPGFLQRYLLQYEKELPATSQILVQCIHFYGSSQASKEFLLTANYVSRKNGTEGVSLDPKYAMTPIFKPSLVESVYKQETTHFQMKSGITMALPANVMRKNLYLPATLFLDNTDSLVDDKSIFRISNEVKSMLA